MILELILIVAILGIFVIIVRKLPDALKESQQGVSGPAPVVVASKSTGWVASWFGFLGRRPKRPVSAAAVATPTSTVMTRSAEAVITEESLLTEGDAYLEEGKLKEAERSYLRAVAKNPKNPKLYNRLGAIYLRQRNYSDALQAFEAARDLDGSKASRHYNVALAAWQLGNLGKARDAISQAISLTPDVKSYQDLKTQIEDGRTEA